MEPFVHELNRREHGSFLNEKRYDPSSREQITDGDRVVVCAGCKSVHLLQSWNDNGRKCPNKDCESGDTLNYIPQEYHDLQFERSGSHTLVTRKKRKEVDRSQYYRKPEVPVGRINYRRFFPQFLYILIPIILLAIVILIVRSQVFNKNIPDKQSESEKYITGEIKVTPHIIEEQKSHTSVKIPPKKDVETHIPQNITTKLGRSNLIENELSRITDTNTLLEKLSYYQNIKMVLSFGNKSEIGNSDGSYVFVVDQKNVIAVLRYENNVYYNVKSTGQFSDLSNRFSGKSVIWVKDYSNIISEKYN